MDAILEVKKSFLNMLEDNKKAVEDLNESLPNNCIKADPENSANQQYLLQPAIIGVMYKTLRQ